MKGARQTITARAVCTVPTMIIVVKVRANNAAVIDCDPRGGEALDLGQEVPQAFVLPIVPIRQLVIDEADV